MLDGAADYEALYRHAACGLVATTSDNTIVHANAMFLAWTGYRLDELASQKRLPDLFSAGARIFHQTHTGPLLAMQGSIAEVKVTLVRKDGQQLPVLLNASRRVEGGAVSHHFAMFVVMDRHKYERELILARASLSEANRRLSETDRQKDVFLATLAHELRNPLATLRNGLTVLRMGSPDSDAAARTRDMMERQLGQLIYLVDDLLDVARVTSGKINFRKTRVSLQRIVSDALDSCMPSVPAANHVLDVDVPVATIDVEGDESRLAQIVVNLINNAVKYTPAGGHIAISLTRDAGEAIFTVADSGIGLAPDALTRIFSMFAQEHEARERAEGGLGIGLSLARRLVELHGGSIVARSDGVGKGSAFVVRLPLAE